MKERGRKDWGVGAMAIELSVCSVQYQTVRHPQPLRQVDINRMPQTLTRCIHTYTAALIFTNADTLSRSSSLQHHVHRSCGG